MFPRIKPISGTPIIACLLFILALSYIFILTVDVPPHWESHLFIESASRVPIKDTFIGILSIGSDSLTGSHGPFNQLYYQILFSLFQYNYVYYRLVKSFFFAGVILFFFLLANKMLKKRYATASSLFILFSFPIFIQTFVFDEGFIIGEFFKIVAIYLFFIDVSRSKSSISLRILITLFSILAIRTYTATFSLMVLFFLYLLLTHREKIKQYSIVVLILLLTKIPLSTTALQFGESTYGFKLTIFYKLLFEGTLHYIISPNPILSEMYYKSFVAIATFFGFWLLVICFIIYLLKNKIHKAFPSLFYPAAFTTDEKQNMLLFLIWAVCEVPIFFVLPETAIRYFAGTLTPLVGAFFCLYQKVNEIVTPRVIRSFFVVLILGAVMTNLLYGGIFRATWGSSFIGMDKVSRFILESDLAAGKKAVVYYYDTSAAPEYYTVDLERNDKYTISTRLIPEVLPLNEFSPEFLDKQKNEENETYVIKRLSSFRNSEYPPLDFDSFENLEMIKTIEGKSNNLFDLSVETLAQVVRSSYKPNLFYIYKLKRGELNK